MKVLVFGVAEEDAFAGVVLQVVEHEGDGEGEVSAGGEA